MITKMKITEGSRKRERPCQSPRSCFNYGMCRSPGASSDDVYTNIRVTEGPRKHQRLGGSAGSVLKEGLRSGLFRHVRKKVFLDRPILFLKSGPVYSLHYALRRRASVPTQFLGTKSCSNILDVRWKAGNLTLQMRSFQSSVPKPNTS